MEFHKDEVKNKVVWTKGADITDGSPRYTFEGRDPATTYERFQVVIYTEMERRYAHDPGSLCNHYYGYVRDDKMECAETIGPYYSVREAKQRTLELFNLFMQQYANQELDSATSESAVHGHDDQQKHFQYQWAVGTPQRKYADMLDKLIPQHDGHTTAAWITFAEELADGAETAFEQEMSSLVAAFKEISERFSPRAVETVYQVIHAPANALLSNEIIPAAEAAEQGASSQELSDLAASGIFGGGPMPELKM